MKAKTFIFIFSVCLFLKTYAQTTTLILKDHSGSIRLDKEQISRETTVLKNILLQSVQKPKDRVIISYIFRNSASISNAKELIFNPPLTSADSTNKLALIQQNSMLKKAKFGFINRVLQELESNAPKSNQTRILESLVKIDFYRQQKGKLKVVILSDMVESSPRRNLLSLYSKSDAQTKAKKDVKRLMQDFDLQVSKNPSLEIDCYLPVGVMENTRAFQFISYYWQTVFFTLFQANHLKFHTL